MSVTQNRIVVAMTGATGQVYGVRALELLAAEDIETHLVLSSAATTTIQQESTYEAAAVRELADHVHDHRNVGAPPASGSFRTRGILVTPCSMKTLADIAHGSARNLIARAADVALKERRRLVVMPREKPLSRIHLKNMLAVTDAGGMVVPPFPSFYQGTTDLDQMVTRTMARTLGYFDVDVDYGEWRGLHEGVEHEDNA